MEFGERVHIVPLGFEFDRVIKVLKKHKPDRVYLLVTPSDPKYPVEMNEEQEHFNRLNEEELKKNGIEVKFVEDDIFDMIKTANCVAKTIIQERGSDVFVNMSAAGKLTSIGATLAARAQGARVYYVFADRYSQNKEEEWKHGLSICNDPEMEPLPNFQIEKIDERLLGLLAFLSKKKEAYTEDLIKFLIEQRDRNFEELKQPSYRGVNNDEKKRRKEEERRVKQKNLNNLNKDFIKPLEKNGYISTNKESKFLKVRITESGKFAVAVNGLLD